MGYLRKTKEHENLPKNIAGQACVRAILSSNLPGNIKEEMKKFILRNIIPDCQRVSPHCLKAHLINTSISMGLSDKEVEKTKNLFRARVGYEGYYLDAGKLKKV